MAKRELQDFLDLIDLSYGLGTFIDRFFEAESLEKAVDVIDDGFCLVAEPAVEVLDVDLFSAPPELKNVIWRDAPDDDTVLGHR
jgi:hypothetical protein